jgi:hypothetical protein
MDVSTRAMLVTLTIGSWSSSKLDKAVTEDVNKAHNADANAGRFTKKLVAKEAMLEIKQIDSAIRAYHYDRTLPWSSEGPRILSTKAFAEYDKEMRTLKDRREIAVRDFIAGFPDHMRAAENSLGQLFQAEDYPDVSEIEGKFTMDLAYSPVPTGNDFRVELSKDITDHLRKEADARTSSVMAKATTSVWQRVFDAVQHMATKLEDYHVTPDGRGPGKSKTEGRLHDTLVSNMADLAGLLPSLNITNDPKLTLMADQLMEKLASHDPQDLRKDAELRQTVAKDARAVLAEIQESLGDI